MTHLLPAAPRNLHGCAVRVHRNLHKACWSITVRGRVVAHVATFALSFPSVIILPSGVRRARARGTRTVHAYLEGILAAAPLPILYSELRYTLPTANGGAFFTVNGNRWTAGSCAHGDARGKAWVSI